MNDLTSSAIILAAGDGKRMKSRHSKVLCEVATKPMISWVISSCEKAGIKNISTIIGNGAEELSEFLPDNIKTFLQSERLGTGHAVMMAMDFLMQNKNGDVIVLCGDAPFIDEKTISQSYEYHKQNNNAVTVITAKLDNPTGYGRIIRNKDGITAIVEQNDANESELEVNEVNSGAYWFSVDSLIDVLGKLTTNNAQGEYYLTDTVSLLLKDGKRADAFIAENNNIILGANDRKTLLKLNEIAKQMILDKHMENGVEFVLTDGVIIAPDVTIEADTKILPGTILTGNTKIGYGCTIGPNCLIDNTVVGDNTVLNAVHAHESIVHNNVKIGPFTQLRPDSEIMDGVKIGDFVEIKNSVIGESTAVAHLTYVGDSDVGSEVNFGCGTVTVNYDGVNKYRTTIGNNAFIGCNTNLVAPVKVGNGAFTAAGTTITKDVPDDALAIGRSHQENKLGFGKKLLSRNKK